MVLFLTFAPCQSPLLVSFLLPALSSGVSTRGSDFGSLVYPHSLPWWVHPVCGSNYHLYGNDSEILPPAGPSPLNFRLQARPTWMLTGLLPLNIPKLEILKFLPPPPRPFGGPVPSEVWLISGLKPWCYPWPFYFSCISNPIHQEILLALLSQWVQNSTPYHLHSYHRPDVIYHHVFTLITLTLFPLLPALWVLLHTAARAIPLNIMATRITPSSKPSVTTKARVPRMTQKDNTWSALLWLQLLLPPPHSLSSCHQGLLSIPRLVSWTGILPSQGLYAGLSAWICPLPQPPCSLTPSLPSRPCSNVTMCLRPTLTTLIKIKHVFFIPVSFLHSFIDRVFTFYNIIKCTFRIIFIVWLSSLECKFCAGRDFCLFSPVTHPQWH